jgi:autotransporter adhesin
LQNIGRGVAPGDAVNVQQLSEGLGDVRAEERQGIAIANAMDVLLPDPGKQFRVNLGGDNGRAEACRTLGVPC